MCRTVTMYKTHFPDYAVEFPAVLSAAYAASDGSVGQILANYTKQAVECRLSPDKDAVLTDDSGNPLKQCPKGRQQTITIPAASVVLLIS